MTWLDAILKLFTTRDVPSIADIIPTSSISFDEEGHRYIVDYGKLNIPFTREAHAGPLMEIPDTNSMDGVMDYGNNVLYIQPADTENDRIMVDWIADTWLKSKGLQTVDAVYRVMADPQASPFDFSEPALFYAIHRLVKIGTDDKGRYFIFKGFNNPANDPYKARPRSIMFLKIGVID